MFEDLIGPPGPVEKSPKQIHWDFDQYKIQSYCYACGSLNIRSINDVLYGDRLENDVQCLNCGAKWREIWDAGIDLDLKELKIGCLKI